MWLTFDSFFSSSSNKETKYSYILIIHLSFTSFPILISLSRSPSLLAHSLLLIFIRREVIDSIHLFLPACSSDSFPMLVVFSCMLTKKCLTTLILIASSYLTHSFDITLALRLFNQTWAIWRDIHFLFLVFFSWLLQNVFVQVWKNLATLSLLAAVNWWYRRWSSWHRYIRAFYFLFRF